MEAHNRYFIELQPSSGAPIPRQQEDEMRRRAALDFITQVKIWLEENDLNEKVSSLDVTMFGQVHITCEAGVINFLRDQDVMNIAAIRQGVFMTESLSRLSAAR